MTFHRLALLSIVLGASLLIADSVVVTKPAHAAVGFALEVGPDRPPPALRHERRPPSPRVGFVWQPGHWIWEGGRWVWADGVWAEPPRIRAAWVPGHWVHRGHHWVWIDGRWV
jgi:hypothetical protein